MKLTILQKESQSQSAKISLLENQLAEKNADLEMRNSKLQMSSREIANLKEKHRKQGEMQISLNQCYEQISLCTAVFKEKFGEELEKLENSLPLFRSLEGRISFAHKRLSTIQG